jgi:hypothetical protein
MKNFIRRLFGSFYVVTQSAGHSYKGSWRKGNFHGYGVLEHSNGSIYKGYFKFGVKHGFGIYQSASGYRYEGQWSKGKQTGSAKISYKNGDWYEGAIENGVRCGLGELSELSSQKIFKGNWKNGAIVGNVQITSCDWKYSGALPDCHGHASGSLTYLDGSVYVGELTNYTRNGSGSYFSASGSQIEGTWVDDLNVNQATATDSEGIKWFGTFKNLKPQGFMKVRLPNGQKYDGLWTDGQMQRAFSVRNRRNSETTYHFH